MQFCVSTYNNSVFHPVVKLVTVFRSGLQGYAFSITNGSAFGGRAGIAVVDMNIDPAADRFKDSRIGSVTADIIDDKLGIVGNDVTVQ